MRAEAHLDEHVAGARHAGCGRAGRPPISAVRRDGRPSPFPPRLSRFTRHAPSTGLTYVRWGLEAARRPLKVPLWRCRELEQDGVRVDPGPHSQATSPSGVDDAAVRPSRRVASQIPRRCLPGGGGGVGKQRPPGSGGRCFPPKCVVGSQPDGDVQASHTTTGPPAPQVSWYDRPPRRAV